MPAPTGGSRIFQVHPLRTCNLRCSHCYSGSAPQQRERLHPAQVFEAIRSAAGEGFDVIGFSGGEPLLYEPLGELLSAARELGLRTTVTTNGMLLDERRAEWLRAANALVAVSIDGVPESHDRLRNATGAFATMQSRLRLLREARIPFGFIFTLTQFNANEIDWVARFAAEQGAQLLQIHPLEIIGRASEELRDAAPDEYELAVAFLETIRLQAEVGCGLTIHFDLLDREHLALHPGAFYADADGPGREKFAEHLAPLVLEPDGTVVPLGHGFPRAFALGRLDDAPLPALMQRWQASMEVDFRRLCRSVWEAGCAPAEWPYFNWYEQVGRRAAEWNLGSPERCLP